MLYFIRIKKRYICGRKLRDLKNRKGIKVFIVSVLVVVFFLVEIAISFSEETPSAVSLPFDTNISLNKRLSNDLSLVKGIEKGEKSFNRFLRKWHIKGASVAIVKDGKLVYAKGFGLANEEDSLSVEPKHLFRVASVSKLITAVAILQMHEEKLLSLDSKVFGSTGILNDSIYLNYPDKRVENITIRHLLNHSAGWYMRYGDHMFMPHSIQHKINCEYPVSVENTVQFA